MKLHDRVQSLLLRDVHEEEERLRVAIQRISDQEVVRHMRERLDLLAARCTKRMELWGPLLKHFVSLKDEGTPVFVKEYRHLGAVPQIMLGFTRPLSEEGLHLRFFFPDFKSPHWYEHSSDIFQREGEWRRGFFSDGWHSSGESRLEIIPIGGAS